MLSLLLAAVIAVAPSITVSSPASGKTLVNPIWLRAHNVGCKGLKPVSFGYSLDNTAPLTLGVTAYDIDQTLPLAPGAHVVHYKSWVPGAECPTVDVAFTAASPVAKPPVVNPYALPETAVSTGALEGATTWKWQHDPGTPGTATGISAYPVNELDGLARQFSFDYTALGGEIYSASFGTDELATHFVYDTYIYLVNPSQVENLEMDINQVLPNGNTQLMCVQCASASGTWEYTLVGTDNKPHWHPSNLPCNVSKWTPDVWHHVQIASQHDAEGNVIYDWVGLDGVNASFADASGVDSLPLGWQPLGDMVLNLQFDGSSKTSGAVTAYSDKLQVWRW